MDGETERKLAAIILGEAQRLRAQASEEVALRPHIRFRPNSQFLKATVQGIQASEPSPSPSLASPLLACGCWQLTSYTSRVPRTVLLTGVR